jgi:hypothetical protein
MKAYELQSRPDDTWTPFLTKENLNALKHTGLKSLNILVLSF